jgi:hypothetical protein
MRGSQRVISARTPSGDVCREIARIGESDLTRASVIPTELHRRPRRDSAMDIARGSMA